MCLNCIFILAILFSSIELGENVLRQSLQDTAKVIISLQRLYQTNCLFLIAVSLKREQDTCEQRVLTDLGKHLSKKKAPNLIVPAIKYNYSMPSYRCSRNRPLNIILTTNTTNSTALNQVPNFKGPVWVAFVEPTMDAEELVEDVYVPMNTEFLIARNTDNEGIVMVEAYNIIPKTPKRWNFFGNWTSEKGLLLNKASLFDRRSDLQGVTFHAVSTNNPPITKVKINGSSMHVEGFVGGVWKIMEKSLNFSTIFHPAIDKTDKGQEYDGKWTAMVNKVADMNFEMGVDALAMTSGRAAKIDYTLPLMTAKYRVFIRKPDKQEVEWTTFLTPFSTAIWLTTLASILATALGIDLTQRFRRMYNRFDETEEDESFSLKNSLFYVFGLLCQQGTDIVPNNYSSRMAYSTACMVAVVLLANYSATLISYLTIRTDKLPFKDLKGLLASGIYTFGTSNNSAQYSYFKDSNDTFVKKLYEKAMAPDPANLPNSKIEGLQRVCNKHYGFLTNYDTAIASRKQISCEIVPLPNEEMDTSLSLILTKDSPYRRYFNHKLLKMREAGLLDKEYHDIMDETKDEFPTTSSVTLEDVTPILSLLAVGIGIAVFVLVVEKYHAKANANHERPSLSSSVSTRSSNWSGSQHGKRKRRFVKPRLTNSSKNLYYTYKKPFKFYPRISTEIFLRMNQWKSRMFKKTCNEKVFNVTFIFIIIWSTSESFYFYTGLDFQYPLQNTANIVTSIQKLYHSNCIFLISLFPESDPDQEELLMLTELGKILSKHSASNAIVHAEDYNYSLPSFRCPRNRPLNVMLATNRTNSTSFIKIIDVKGPVWMLYTGARTIIDNLLSEFYIPISVEFLIAQTLPNETVLLSEVYRIDYSTPLLKNLVGDWNDKRGLNTTKLSFFKRRQNFHGVTLMAVTTSNPPFTYLYGNTSNLTIDGFVGKVWKTIETGFNFSTTFHISLDSMGHNRKVDGKWSAMIDAVASSVVQFGVDAFTMTSARARVVDFTWPLISTKYKVYIRKPNQQAVDWNTFLTPLSKGIWITTGVFVVVVAIGLHVTQQLRRIFISFTASQEDPGSFSFDNSLFYVYGLLCQQGSDIMPRSLPCRIAFSTACIIAVVLLANYSATLISFLAVRIEKLPFLDLEGLLHDGSYQFGTVNRSAYYYYYTESNDTFRSTLYWKTMVKDRKNFPSNNLEGLKRVCEINFGFLTTTETAEILKKNLSCEIVYLPKERFDASLGIILTKGSPYRRLINHRLLSMHEGGLLKQQYRTIMDPTHNENSDTISVTIVDVAPILILLATGIALASLILLMEICFSKSGSPSPVFRDSVPRRQQRSTLFQKRRKLGVRQRRSNVSKPFYYYYKKPFQFSPRITVQMYRTHFNQFH